MIGRKQNNISVFPVKIGYATYSENTASIGNRVWKASTLVEKVKELKLEPFKLQIQAIDLSASPWTGKTIYDIAGHVKRALAADLSHPVIMSEYGWIMDGWHRILKAIIEDKPYVLAVRFELDPVEDYTVNNE